MNGRDRERQSPDVRGDLQQEDRLSHTEGDESPEHGHDEHPVVDHSHIPAPPGPDSRAAGPQDVGKLADQSLEEVKGAPSHLEAFRLYLDGRSYETVAEKTGLSETAAKVAVHRLRAKLRKILIGRIAETVDSKDDLQAELSEFVDLLS